MGGASRCVLSLTGWRKPRSSDGGGGSFWGGVGSQLVCAGATAIPQCGCTCAYDAPIGDWLAFFSA